MQDSSHLGTCQNDLQTSGGWLSLEPQERKTISKLVLQRAAIERDLNTVHQMLRGCNDPVRLAELTKECGGKRDFRHELRQLSQSLDARTH